MQQQDRHPQVFLDLGQRFLVAASRSSEQPPITVVLHWQLALRKRPVTMESIDAAVDRIEERLITLGEREVLSEKVGELVMRELKRLDKIAYVRFASVYRNFEDVDEFRDAVREVTKPRVSRTRS